jgi:nucleotide-binding universal stress UspA family protein
MKEFKNILYPIALTEISKRVAPYVVTLSKQLDAKVHLIHVLRRFDWFVDTYISEESPKPDFKRIASDFEGQVLLQAERKLDSFIKKYLKDIDVVNAKVVSGTHYKKILEYVETAGIDLIIMGRGTAIEKVVFGSVAEKVSRFSPVPVMLIKSS